MIVDWGRIINISSVHGLKASPNKTAYIAAKHGLVGLTKVKLILLSDTRGFVLIFDQNDV